MKREKEETGVKAWEGALKNVSFDDITQVVVTLRCPQV